MCAPKMNAVCCHIKKRKHDKLKKSETRIKLFTIIVQPHNVCTSQFWTVIRYIYIYACVDKG